MSIDDCLLIHCLSHVILTQSDLSLCPSPINTNAIFNFQYMYKADHSKNAMIKSLLSQLRHRCDENHALHSEDP